MALSHALKIAMICYFPVGVQNGQGLVSLAGPLAFFVEKQGDYFFMRTKVLNIAFLCA
jgi:hypothetical protein